MINVEVIRAWPRRFESTRVVLADGAVLADAVMAAGWSNDPTVAGYAVFGERATLQTPLREGDRVELLRPLQMDPKEARRRRAAAP